MATPKILVVEDDDKVRRLLAEHLTARMPAEVDSARDGVEALYKITTTKYGAVILDVIMPKMSGVDLLDSLSAHLSDPSVKTLDAAPPILVITAAPAAALSDEVIKKRCPGAVKQVFRKPLDVVELAECVERYLA